MPPRGTNERARLTRLEGWPEDPHSDGWRSSLVTDLLLGLRSEGRGRGLPRDWVRVSLARVIEMRDALRKSWVGLDLSASGQGHLTDWLLACLIARESALLLGGPGIAKTEIAERTFELLGLERPNKDRLQQLPQLPLGSDDIHEWWMTHEAEERQKPKYLSYLLNRFTEPEEIFGPIEISLLRRGAVVRVNFGMMTGPGVQAAFLDEIFKASSSILNAMLRLVLNREHFNWGGMRRSDLLLLVAASNELPGGLGAGEMGVSPSGEDFHTLHAFLDRFPMRLLIPPASGSSDAYAPEKSHLAEATKLAIKREGARFTTSETFERHKWHDRAVCLNDLLLVGRAMLQDGKEAMFDPPAVTRFETTFLRLAAQLQHDGTGTRPQHVSWTISPRKLKAVWKIALAHAVIHVSDPNAGFAGGDQVVEGPRGAELHAFDWIWDTPRERYQLQDQVKAWVARHG